MAESHPLLEAIDRYLETSNNTDSDEWTKPRHWTLEEVFQELRAHIHREHTERVKRQTLERAVWATVCVLFTNLVLMAELHRRGADDVELKELCNGAVATGQALSERVMALLELDR